jgi:hypothetical protein
MRIRNALKVLSLSIALLAPAFVATAQTAVQATVAAPSVEAYSCPDVQGVKVTLSFETLSTSAGIKLPIHARLQNNNDFPIVDGSLLVKISRESKNELLVERYFPVEGVSIAAHEYKDVYFTWDIPAATVTGFYRVNAYFVSVKQFAVGGLLSSDEGTTSGSRIYITGDEKGSLSFDKTKLTMNDIPYGGAAANNFTSKQPIVVKVPIVNSTGETQTVPVLVKLYHWDGISDTTIIDQKTETITVDKTKGATLEYTILDGEHAAYQLIAEISYKGSKAILTARASRNVNESIVRFVGLAPFPMQGDKTKIGGAKIFGCVYNTIVGESADKKIDLSLTDDSNKTLATVSYPIPANAVFGFAKTIDTPNIRSSSLDLTARVISKDGKEESVVVARYECDKFSSVECATKNPVATGSEDWSMIYAWAMATGGFGVALFLLMHHKRI